MEYIRPATIKRVIKERGFRCGKDFLEALDRAVYWKVVDACETFNGHKKTLNAELVEPTLKSRGKP